MKVEVLHRSEKEMERCDYRDAMEIYIDGKKAFSVSDGEPEGFWRKGNVDIVCDRYNIPLFVNLNDSINHMKNQLTTPKDI